MPPPVVVHYHCGDGMGGLRGESKPVQIVQARQISKEEGGGSTQTGGKTKAR